MKDHIFPLAVCAAWVGVVASVFAFSVAAGHREFMASAREATLKCLENQRAAIDAMREKR